MESCAFQYVGSNRRRNKCLGVDQRTLRTWGSASDLDVVCFEYTEDTSPLLFLLFVWWISIVGLTSSPCSMKISLLRLIHRLMKKIVLRWAQSRANRMEEQGGSNQGNFSEESSADGFSDLDELANLEEQMEIEQFLAEIRSSEVQSSTLSLSTHARKEFIANVLISQVNQAWFPCRSHVFVYSQVLNYKEGQNGPR